MNSPMEHYQQEYFHQKYLYLLVSSQDDLDSSMMSNATDKEPQE